MNDINQDRRHVARAEKARQGLAEDLRGIHQVGGNLIRTGEKRLRKTALTLGAVLVGGVVVGIVLSRTSSGGRGRSLVFGLVGKAAAAFAATLATQLVSRASESLSGR